jgi:hypothetical protein
LSGKIDPSSLTACQVGHDATSRLVSYEEDSYSSHLAVDVDFDSPSIPRSNYLTIARSIMSGPMNIGSAAEWQSLLSGTTVVIADCTKHTHPSPRSSTIPTTNMSGHPYSLRRLVRSLQDDRPSL